MAVRSSQQRLSLLDGIPDADPDATPTQQVSALPSVRRLAAIGATPASPAEDGEPPPPSLLAAAPQQAAALSGDDDDDADLDDTEFDSQDDFYADVMDSR